MLNVHVGQMIAKDPLDLESQIIVSYCMGKSLLCWGIFPWPWIIKKLSNLYCHLNNSLKSFNTYINIESLHTFKKMYEVTKWDVILFELLFLFFLTSFLRIIVFFNWKCFSYNIFFYKIFSSLIYFIQIMVSPSPSSQQPHIFCSYPLLIFFF